MRSETTNILLVLLGGALVKITIDGTATRYVKLTTQPWVLAAGIVMISLALIAILRDVVTQPASDDHHHTARWTWLLLLPALAVFVVAPPALGADSVLHAGNRTSPPIAALSTLPDSAVAPLPLNEFVTRSVWDASSLHGRTVALTGFVVHENNTDYVARLVITCCAADATPMKVALTGQLASRLANDQWIQVNGQLRPNSATEANGYTPTLVVSVLTTATAPADPYEH